MSDGQFANGRLARIVSHVSTFKKAPDPSRATPSSSLMPLFYPLRSSALPAPPKAPLLVAPSSGGDGRPVVVMLEPPAEDAIPSNLVEDAFGTHDLKVVWALGEMSEVPKNAAALVTVKKKVDAALLDKLPSLRLIAVAFTGYDHVDLE